MIASAPPSSGDQPDRSRDVNPSLHVGLVTNIAITIRRSLEHMGYFIETEDLVGEISLLILQRGNTYDPKRGKASTWIMTCRSMFWQQCRRRFTNQRRQQDGSWRGLPKPFSSDRTFRSKLDDGADTVVTLKDRRPPASSQDDYDALRSALELLDPRAAYILNLRARGRSLEAIGVLVNLSKERVRQIERSALADLAAIMGSDIPPSRSVGEHAGRGRRRRTTG